MSYCTGCTEAVANEGPPCPFCVRAAREYVAAVDKALRGGVFLDRGTVRNAWHDQKKLDRYEANGRRT